MNRSIALAACFLVTAILPAPLGASEPLKTFVPTSQYQQTNLIGWTVLVNKALLAEQRSLGSNALALLAEKLREITNAVPERACFQLQQVRIWLGVNDGHAPCAEYHPSASWLRDHGFNPDKARAVEIGNAKRFLSWSASQPSMVLHELAHAFHDQFLGHAYGPIKAAYQRALASGSYGKVKRNNGRVERAYAMNNDQEYFAETTEAYFGTNDFFPFIRQELKEHDPTVYSVLEQAWRP